LADKSAISTNCPLVAVCLVAGCGLFFPCHFTYQVTSISGTPHMPEPQPPIKEMRIKLNPEVISDTAIGEYNFSDLNESPNSPEGIAES
jgi:hypothetical protein